jgi:hypothetical protein
VRGHELCEGHLRQAVRYRSVRHVSSGAIVTVGCDHQKADGRRCGRAAIVLGARAPIRAYCAKHAKSAPSRKNVPTYCVYEKSGGRRCGRDAIVVWFEPGFAAYCWKHLDRVEVDATRCRARTATGARCRNPVSSSGNDALCGLHDSSPGRIYHYATDDLWYE